jgi:hypothetical protein
VTNEQDFDSMKLMETIQASFDHLKWENPMRERCKDALHSIAALLRQSIIMIFQMAEVAVPKALFLKILERIRRLALVTIRSGAG